MLRRSPPSRRQRDRAIEGDEPPSKLHGKRKKIDIRRLAGPVNAMSRVVRMHRMLVRPAGSELRRHVEPGEAENPVRNGIVEPRREAPLGAPR